MSNTAVTIGNTTAEDFAHWLDRNFGFTGGATIVDSIGFWNGKRERSIIATFWGMTPDFARNLLTAYGTDHPNEEAFGILQSTFSDLFGNPAHVNASADHVEIKVPDVFPEDWNP